MPRISVLLPYRDAADTIGEALDSVLAQRGPSFEVIAIDDGSKDAPALPAGVVRVATGGVGIARALAIGLAHARGEYIARMDADDVSLPGRFEAQCALLDRDRRLGVVGTRVEAFPHDALAEYLAWQNALVSPEEHARDVFVESPLCHPSVMIRRTALDDAGGFRDPPWAEDYDLWLRLHARGHAMAKVPQVLLRWRHRHQRVTFRDPRCALLRFFDAKASYLAPILGPFVVWGAGRVGKRLARALEPHGKRPAAFIDIDPRKIGRVARTRPIVSPADLPRGHQILVAVGAPGARAIIRGRLDALGLRETEDYFCAA